MHHICFEVDDLPGALASLKAAGVRLIDEAPRPGARGHLVAPVALEEASEPVQKLRLLKAVRSTIGFFAVKARQKKTQAPEIEIAAAQTIAASGDA